MTPPTTAPMILDTAGQPLRRKAGAWTATRPSGAELMRLPPSLSSADGDLLGDKRELDARVRENIRNDGYLAGARRVHVDNVVGHQFRLNARPNWRLLRRIDPRLDETWAEEFAEVAEERFTDWAEDDTNCWADAQRVQSFTQQVRLVASQLFEAGEFLATAEWLGRGPYRTAIQTIDPDRLCNPMGVTDGPSLRRGVVLGPRGEPVAYHVRVAHPDDRLGFGVDSYRTKTIRRFKRWGRLQVLHLFDRERADQNRGVSRVVAGLRGMEATRHYSDLVLQNMAVNAMYAATLESDLDRGAAMELIGVENPDGTREEVNYYDWMMDQIAVYADHSTLRLDGAKIPYLPIGTKLKLNAARNNGGIGENFERSLTRRLAAAIGVSHERFIRDWSETNYSSARASGLEDWKFFLACRRFGPTRFASMVYRLVLEEMWYRGDVPLPRAAPDFWSHPAAYAGCTWRGAGRGQIDPVKETGAAVMRMESDLSTLERESAEIAGEDWREIQDQRARERRRAASLGLLPEAAPADPADQRATAKPRIRVRGGELSARLMDELVTQAAEPAA